MTIAAKSSCLVQVIPHQLITDSYCYTTKKSEKIFVCLEEKCSAKTVSFAQEGTNFSFFGPFVTPNDIFCTS